MDQLLRTRYIDLLAQVVDVDIDQVAVGFVGPPALLQQVLAAHGLSAATHEHLQQFKLSRAEPHFPRAAMHLARDRIHLQIFDAADAQGRVRFAAQDRAGAGREFLERKRLGDIVVGAQVERFNAIGDLVARAEHKDGRSESFRAQLLEQA
jgi:hypothetical protein